MTDLLNPPPVIYPLFFLLVLLLAARQVRDTLKPVISQVVAGLTEHAKKNAFGYAIGSMLATLASLQSLGEVARDAGWIYVDYAVKVFQPGLAAAIAFMRPSPATKNGSGTTAPPFPVEPK
jgi:hypothetical protein